MLVTENCGAQTLGRSSFSYGNSSELERFFVDGALLHRDLRTRDGVIVRSSIENHADSSEVDAHRAYEQSFLRAQTKPQTSRVRGEVRIVDLFCGAGGTSVGIDEACRALGLLPIHVFAADINLEALETYKANFSPAMASSSPIEAHLSGKLGARLTAAERRFKDLLGAVDIAVGGPPCQGHSNLNNHTRRADPKNSLYDRMARFAEVVRPTHLIIENVPGVRHDVGGVYDRTVRRLISIGYRVVTSRIEADAIGVPQRRHRELVVASLSENVNQGFFEEIHANFGCEPRSVSWAISDLLSSTSDDPIDVITKVSAVSRKRIDWLFDNDQYDLPDRMRPDCHKLNDHSYKAVYGRLYWDQPAWTITTGFQVMGQGRFLHPTERRVITSHEAARLQFFPDFFRFMTDSRKGFAKMIGNAVPSKLSYALAVSLLR